MHDLAQSIQRANFTIQGGKRTLAIEMLIHIHIHHKNKTKNNHAGKSDGYAYSDESDFRLLIHILIIFYVEPVYKS